MTIKQHEEELVKLSIGSLGDAREQNTLSLMKLYYLFCAIRRLYYAVGVIGGDVLAQFLLLPFSISIKINAFSLGLGVGRDELSK